MRFTPGGLQMASWEDVTDSREGLGVLKLYVSLKMFGSGTRSTLSAGDAIVPSESVKPGVQGVVSGKVIGIIVVSKAPSSRSFICHKKREIGLLIYRRRGWRSAGVAQSLSPTCKAWLIRWRMWRSYTYTGGLGNNV